MLSDLLDWANKRWRKSEDKEFLEQLVSGNNIRYPEMFELEIEFINSDKYVYGALLSIN